ncbi:hypothetical protein DKX38_010932 [Salix brachista]|uniref:Peptide methionine sulfoxide reductase A5 n=1 Tax=Salix brachista TaxID=2182728 RepID=A0A5N5M028_9ROSI|nr:hypothetical protein DKX38_010932 [Salix brachista]
MASAESNSATHLHLLTLLLLTISLPNRSLSIRIPDRVSTAIRNPPPDYPLKIAVFALGCFWRSEAVFGCLNGVVRTTVGYCGGSKLSPVYRSLGDHAESVQVEYDPKVISYTQLLEVFWASHDSRQVFGQGPDVGNQYRSVIFTNGTEERRLAGVSKEREQLKLRSSVVVTQIQQLGTFYPAEPEHQFRAVVEVLENAGKIFGRKFEAYFETFGQCQYRMSNIVLVCLMVVVRSHTCGHGFVSYCRNFCLHAVQKGTYNSYMRTWNAFGDFRCRSRRLQFPYVQKFELKQSPFLRQLMGNLPEVDLENLSLAAKLNGYAAELCPPGIQKQIDAKINDILRKGWPVLRDV